MPQAQARSAGGEGDATTITEIRPPARTPIFGEELENYLKSVQQALRVAGDLMEQRNHRRIWDMRGLAKMYAEGRLWLVCDFEGIGGCNQRAALACLYHDFQITNEYATSFPRKLNSGEFGGCNKNSMLIDIAEIVQDPEGVSFPTLVCLHFVDEVIVNDSGAGSERIFDRSLEVRYIGGDGEVDAATLASHWLGQCGGDIIKRASHIGDSISDDRVYSLIRLMQRIKKQFDAASPLFRFKSKSVEICCQKLVDSGLNIRNVFVCAS